MDKKIWFITGISSGLGKALAQAVIDSGDYVIGTLRTKEQVETFNKQHSGKARAYALDLKQVVNIDKVVNQAISEFGSIDVLVNNAGVGFIGAVEEASFEEIRNTFEVNFFSALRLTQACLPHFRKQRSGHIIQVSSHGGIKAFAGFGIYNASKFALEGFSEALAQEVAALGIHISIVEPGPFKTNFASGSLPEARNVIEDYNDTAGAFRAKLKSVNGHQEGDPKKAANAILKLVNSQNPSLRLPLGKTALKTIQMKLDSVKSDLETNRKIAEEVVFDQ
ncbi:MAG: oxidoreductase [Cyclobacteriaceae bacterium]